MEDFESIGFRARLALTSILWSGWVVFMLAYMLFWSAGDTMIKGLAIIIMSLVIAMAVTVLLWASWAFKMVRKHRTVEAYIDAKVKQMVDKYAEKRVKERLRK